jgi:hypothetical protein
MKRRALILLVVLALALSTLGCVCGGIDFGTVRWGGVKAVRGSGKVVEEERQVSGFTSVELATSGSLTIGLGGEEELRIEAEDNLLEYIETEVRGGRLRIKTQDNVTLRNTRPINYYLTVKALDDIVISSSGDIEAPDLEAERFIVTISSSGDLVVGDLDAGTLEVEISSSGDMKMGDLYADSIEVSITSSGNLDIAGGEVEEQDITISSSGKYRAGDLESARASVRLTSSGSATIWVRDHLQANLSSSGDVRYIGNPKVDARTTSSGDIEQVGE